MVHTAVLLGADSLQHHHAAVLWIKKMRSNLLALWIISFIVSIGMWLERL